MIQLYSDLKNITRLNLKNKRRKKIRLQLKFGYIYILYDIYNNRLVPTIHITACTLEITFKTPGKKSRSNFVEAKI